MACRLTISDLSTTSWLPPSVTRLALASLASPGSSKLWHDGRSRLQTSSQGPTHLPFLGPWLRSAHLQAA